MVEKKNSNFMLTDRTSAFRDLFTVKKEERSVEVSRLGFLFVKHQITVMFGIDEQAWRHDKWAALVTNGLTSFMLYLKNVDYAVMRSPLTGKQAIVLIDSSTSTPTPLPAFIHHGFAAIMSFRSEAMGCSLGSVGYCRWVCFAIV